RERVAVRAAGFGDPRRRARAAGRRRDRAARRRSRPGRSRRRARTDLRGVPERRHATRPFGHGPRPCDRARTRGRARRIGPLRGHSRRRRDVRVYVSTGGPGRVTTILLVEDDPALRRALRTMMRSRDLDVLDVATGEDAVVLASSGTPDLLVLDL